MPLFTSRKRRAGALARFRYSGSKASLTPYKRVRTSGYRRKGMRAKLHKYNVHSYKRHATTGIFQFTSASNATTKLFTLNDTVNSSELTALYDQYKITGVKMRFRLVTNPDSDTIPNSSVTLNTTNTYPTMWSVRDYDNVAAESIAELQQRNNVQCVVMQPNKYYNYFIRPAVRNQIFLDGVTTASSPMWNQWIDCANADVPHYGFKFCIDPTSNNVNNWIVRWETVYYLKFKNAR